MISCKIFSKRIKPFESLRVNQFQRQLTKDTASDQSKQGRREWPYLLRASIFKIILRNNPMIMMVAKIRVQAIAQTKKHLQEMIRVWKRMPSCISIDQKLSMKRKKPVLWRKGRYRTISSANQEMMMMIA